MCAVAGTARSPRASGPSPLVVLPGTASDDLVVSGSLGWRACCSVATHWTFRCGLSNCLSGAWGNDGLLVLRGCAIRSCVGASIWCGRHWHSVRAEPLQVLGSTLLGNMLFFASLDTLWVWAVCGGWVSNATPSVVQQVTPYCLLLLLFVTHVRGY